MNRNRAITAGSLSLALILTAARPLTTLGQDRKDPYRTMAPIEQYLMESQGEIALARSAAPEAISRDAKILVLGRHGFETVVEGKNGFACLVERSWTAPYDDPEFWNPKIRGAICYNLPGVQSVLPLTLKKTDLALAGRSKVEISEAISIAIKKKELPEVAPGAMCYMLSKQSYLSDRDGRWHPHLMFFVPLTDLASWGANEPGSPLIGDEEETDRLTVFLLPVGTWSDGTTAPLIQ